MTGIRRMLAAAAIALLLLVLTPAIGVHADQLTFGLTYRDDIVNLRSQPSSSSQKLGSYSRGTWMRITGSSGNWYSVVAPDGRVGYMSRNYVEVTSEKSAYIGIVTNQKSTAFLNLREYPSYSAKVLGIYYNGVPCILLSESDGWYHVRVNGVDGYFRREYLTLKNQVYSEQVATIVTPGLTAMNLRTGPDKSYGAIKQFAGGRYVMVLQQGSGWWKVAIDGYVGYMDASYLRMGVLTPTEAAQAGGSVGPKVSYALVTNPKATQVLNLRESPTTTARSIGQFRNGVRLTVLEQGTEWCHVMSTTGLSGYMMTRYLTLINLPATPTRRVVHPQGSYVNLRALPMSYASVLTRVPSGSSVIVVTPGESWLQVRYNGVNGYMMASFLE